MLIESFIILGIIVFVCIISLRTKKDYAVAISPLIIPPAVNIIGHFFASSIAKITPFDRLITYILLCMVAVLVSGALLGVFSLKFKTKKLRLTYLIMCLVFVFALEIIFIADYASKFSGS